MAYIERIKAFKDIKVLVIGDMMLDKYIIGSVSRISPEAPVPILSAKKEKKVPGGAANVASNIKALGGTPLLIGIIGDDSAGKDLLSELSARSIGHSHVIVSPEASTTQKVRMISGSQQLLRLDFEEHQDFADETICRLVARAMPSVDIVVVSDYAKGVVSEKTMRHILDLAKDIGKKVIIDPKPVHKHLYKGAFLITPNQNEAEALAGARISGMDEQRLREIGDRLNNELSANILMTRGELGMTLFSDDGISNLPTQAREVFDVSGAGDTVVAAAALAIASGTTLFEAADIANHAAGIVVGKAGTATATAQELIGVFERDQKKLKSTDELKAIISSRQGRKVVFTNGCFDILHPGHVSLLRQAKAFGDLLIVGLNSDVSVRRLKGPARPILNEGERAELLSALECVDYVTIFEDDDPCRIIAELKPDIHVKGGDYNPDDHEQMPEAKVVKSYGGAVKIVKLIDGKSTTGIIDRVLSKN